MTLDANGNLYGLAEAGGAYHNGTVWEFQASPSVVPEASSLVLAVLALVLMPLVLRRFV